MKTERLYYSNCYLREFEARVVEIRPDSNGFLVYLDKSAFYPESGGQPADHGSLGGIPVQELREDGDAIAHRLGEKPHEETIKGEIDWARRFDHMQQHTGQHVLSAAFEKTGEYKTVSFHLGSEVSSIDLDSDRLGRSQIEKAEDLANQIIFEDREVRIFFRPADEANRLDLRKATQRAGDVRLVEVADFDLSACGGTHVTRSGAIGLIVVRKFERTKSLSRVEFLCGGRALKACRQAFQTLTEAARLFSGPSEQLPNLIAKQAEESRSIRRAHEKLGERLAKLQAHEFWSTATERHGRKIVRQVFPAEEHAVGKQIAHEIAAQPSCVALIGILGKPANLYFSQSPGGAADLVSTLKRTLEKFGGKGGGTRDFAQGGGLDANKLDEALAFAESLL